MVAISRLMSRPKSSVSLKRPDVFDVTASNPDGAHRDVGCAACGTSYAGSGDGIGGVERLACSDDHFFSHFLAHGGLLFQHLVGDVKEVFFHLIGIRHDAALEIL